MSDFHMQDSRIIEVDGVFLGAAVALPDEQGWRFVAANHRVVQLDGRVLASLSDVRRLARQGFLAAGGLVPSLKEAALF
jgi:hypothetical protein